MVANVLGVRCTPSVKGLGKTEKTADRCALLLLHAVVATAAATSSAEVEKKYSRGGIKKVFEGGGVVQTYYKRLGKKNVGFSMLPTRLGEAESNPLFNKTNSATLKAPSIATVLGRDPDMRRNVTTAHLLAPQPKVRERTLGRRRAARRKNEVHTHLYTCITAIIIKTAEPRKGSP